MSPLTPEVVWAQRSNATDAAKNIVYLTINAAEIKPDSLKLDIQPNTVIFSGTNNKDVSYAVELPLYAEINPEESKRHISARGVELILRKKEAKAEFWPRLLKESKKMHFLKTDFDKWVDEDEQDEKDDLGYGDDFGGMDGGMGGMGGMGGLDFSKLAASQGLGDLSGMPTGTGHDSDDDEEMPELEDTGATNAGIEEITEKK